MKYLGAAVSALAWMAVQAAPGLPAQAPPPPPPDWAPLVQPAPPDLRQALEQYHPDSAAAPRQLTPAERAELRRQLSEFAQPAREPPRPQRRR